MLTGFERAQLDSAGFNRVEVIHEHPSIADGVSVLCSRECSACGFSSVALFSCVDEALTHLHTSPFTGLFVRVAYGYEMPLAFVTLGV